MLLALHLVVATIAPIGSTPVLKEILRNSDRRSVFQYGAAAILTCAAHSSVAVILMIVGLAAAGAVTPMASVALVLGANLGGAVPPVFETSGANPANRRVPAGNLVFRALGCALALPFTHALSDVFWRYSDNPTTAITSFHLAFNLVLLLACIGLLDPMAAGLNRRLLERKKLEIEVARPQFLEIGVLDTPYLALSNAAREILRMGDLVGELLRMIPAQLEGRDEAAVDRAKQLGRGSTPCMKPSRATWRVSRRPTSRAAI